AADTPPMALYGLPTNTPPPNAKWANMCTCKSAKPRIGSPISAGSCVTFVVGSGIAATGTKHILNESTPPAPMQFPTHPLTSAKGGSQGNSGRSSTVHARRPTDPQETKSHEG